MEEAAEYFERMMSEDRMKPTNFMFSNLVKGYAARKDLKSCFQLFNRVYINLNINSGSEGLSKHKGSNHYNSLNYFRAFKEKKHTK